jgi:squalene-hopene/tetraprenyl-beta-curcumene cyclase
MVGRQFQLMIVSFVFAGMLNTGVFHGAALYGGEQKGEGQEKKERPNQYQFEIAIPGAFADEPVRTDFSLKRAVEHIEQGAIAWTQQRRCVTCHTNGTYMVIRPALTPILGKPSHQMRGFFIDESHKFIDKFSKSQGSDREKFRQGIRPTQMAYIAAGLAEWDAHVTRKLSAETDEALRLLFDLQSDNGQWSNTDCWPPFESSAYHGTTVAAMAAATAPGWLSNLKDEKLLAGVAKMKQSLQSTPPPNDYGRVLLLWTATRLPGLIGEERKQELIETIWKHQRSDGGWSIRSFATPETWGGGKRAKKLRAEPEFKNPPSDGHQTGLAVIVLRDAGVPADDPRLKKAVHWLLTNQRESGRWWTRSLNTDRWHFITYSGTCYPLLALAKCGALPTDKKTAAK